MVKGNILLRHAALCIILFTFLITTGQPAANNKYPQGYFSNPLGIPMSLSANFGELRPGHWHMGLDLRTDRKENLSVFAAADGYIAHIGIRPMSFGRFIVINHPNGYSTLYAHLNDFYPGLEKYVRAKQTEKESWPIEIDFSEKEFRIKKGDFIGKSGNTGGSQGPHLHFEIRDTKTGRCLNPQLFGFPINDNVPPTIARVALYDRNMSTWLQTPQIIGTVKTGNDYLTKPRKILTGTSKISFAIAATDRSSGSSGANGIFRVDLYVDNKPKIVYLIDNIDYDESDYINAHIDKRYRNSGGPYLQHLSLLPGFRCHIYEKIDGDGVIELNDTLTHDIRIEVCDVNENISTLKFQVRYNDSLAKKINRPVYSRMLMPNKVNIIEEKEFEATLPDYSLYDSVPFVYGQQNIFSPGAVSAQHRLSDPVYPTHETFPVRIKMTKQVPESLKNKIVIERIWKNQRTVRKAELRNNWLTASFGDFGDFQAFVDTTAPQINTPAKAVKARLPDGQGKDTLDMSPLSRIVFIPTDNFGLRSFRAELDGKWLKFSNDKGRSHIYIFDEQCPYGVHELKVRVEDIVGNVTEKTWWFKKYSYKPPPKKKVVSKKKATPKKK